MPSRCHIAPPLRPQVDQRPRGGQFLQRGLESSACQFGCQMQASCQCQVRGQGMRSRHVRTAELQLSMPPNRPGGFCHLAQNIGA